MALLTIQARIIFNHIPQGIARLQTKIDDAVERVGDDAVDLAHSIVPVDTGQLRTSIHRTDNARGGWVTILAGGEAAFYAGYIEFGTVKMAARPFLTPAARFAQEVLPDRIRAAVTQAFGGL